MSQLLQVSALQKNYGQQEVIKNISFELTQGTATALIGPNGAGKTTILSMLAGLLKPTNGQIQFDGIVGDPRAAISFTTISTVQFLANCERIFNNGSEIKWIDCAICEGRVRENASIRWIKRCSK